MEQGYFCNILDGDNVRTGLNYNLSFGEADRYENIRRIAEVARLFMNCGIITLCTFVSPTIALRNLAKQIIGDENFIEVFIDADLETCEKRDVKGLYKKARRGEISDFTGISALFEEPVHPALILKTGQLNLDESVQILLNYIKPYIQLQN
jgi:adenylylsulfate kinase